MKRLFVLLRWDMRCQMKYGFYGLYGCLTVLYMLMLQVFSLYQEDLAVILIFSDPAAMGLFFMGAILLLEKTQHLPAFYAVSPLFVREYVASKVLSLSLIALVVATLLALTISSKALDRVLLGTFLASVICTLCGILAATKITSLNQFILVTVPLEGLLFVPAILHLFGLTPAFLSVYPMNVCIDLMASKKVSLTELLVTFILIMGLFCLVCRAVRKMWLTPEECNQ